MNNIEYIINNIELLMKPIKDSSIYSDTLEDLYYESLLNQTEVIIMNKPKGRPILKDNEAITSSKIREYKRNYRTKYYKANREIVLEKQKERMAQKKAFVRSYAKRQKCQITGNTNKLEFHHLRDKSFNVSDAGTKSWKRILDEMDKCVVLTNNAHKIVHRILNGLSIREEQDCQGLRTFMKKYYKGVKIIVKKEDKDQPKIALFDEGILDRDLLS